MKNTILILISLLFVTGISEGKEVSYLQDRNGIKYEINSEIGFTGKYVTYYENGQKEREINYKDGKREGLWTFWDTEGNVTKTETYKDGGLVN